MAGLSGSSLFFLFVLLGGQFVLFAFVLSKRAQEFRRARRAGPPPEKKKFWIRRHKILALLAPFGAAMLFCSASSALGSACSGIGSSSYGGPLEEFFGDAFAGIVFPAFSWFLFFDRTLSSDCWLALPLYVFPAVAFLLSRRATAAVAFYALHCLLVLVTLFAGLDALARSMP